MTRHTWRPGGATYYPMDGARQGDPLEPDDVIAALDAHMEHTGIVDAMAQEIENLRAELDGRAPVSPTAHWSPWLEWRGGPCPLPGDVDVEWERSKSGTIEPACEWTWAQYCRFRYRADNPAGWLPRGKFIPPAELWDEGCPVRCEWAMGVHTAAHPGTAYAGGAWADITHIRLVAREAKAELPGGFEIRDDGVLVEKAGVALLWPGLAKKHGTAAIRQAVDAWLREMGDE